MLAATWFFTTGILAGPALAMHVWLRRRGESDDRLLLVLPMAVVGVLGYAAFFVYYAHPDLGRCFSLAVTASGWAFVFHELRHGGGRGLGDLPTIVLATLGIGLFYLALLYLLQLGSPYADQSAVRFVHRLPSDPILPQMMADRLYSGESLRPFAGDWLSNPFIESVFPR